MSDVETARYFAEKHLRWHQFRPWGGPNPKPRAVDPCGDCGRARAEHPYPWFVVTGVDDTILLARLIASMTDAAPPSNNQETQ